MQIPGQELMSLRKCGDRGHRTILGSSATPIRGSKSVGLRRKALAEELYGNRSVLGH